MTYRILYTEEATRRLAKLDEAVKDRAVPPLFALLSIEIYTGRFSRFHFPGFDQRELVVSSHLHHEIHEAGNGKLLHVGSGGLRYFNIKDLPACGNQDLILLPVDVNHRAVKTAIFSEDLCGR